MYFHLNVHYTLYVKVTQSCLTLQHHGLYSPWNSPGQNTGVGSCSLLQKIFPTQGSNPGLPRCRWILYHLSHKGSPTTCTTFSSSTESSVQSSPVAQSCPTLCDPMNRSTPGLPVHHLLQEFTQTHINKEYLPLYNQTELTCIYIIFSHIQIPHSTLYHFKRFLYHLNLVELKNRKNS